MSAWRSAALVAALATALAPVLGLRYGVRDGVLTWALLVGVGSVALAVAHLLARRRRSLGPLRRQFALAVAIAVGQLVVALVAGAALMFVSVHDATLVVVLALFAGAVAARAASLFAAGVMADIDRLRGTLVAVGQGARTPGGPTEARDELHELGLAADAAIEQLARAEAARRDLVAAVSHDLRTPLTALTLLASAVGDDVVDDETRRRYPGEMHVHIRSLSGLIDDLFELSSLEAGELRWSIDRVELAALVREAVDAMRPEADAGRVRLRAHVAGTVVTRADVARMQRVLFNLIQNAIRHTPPGGTVTVTAEALGDHVQIEVADTGEGIPADVRGRVFDPFFRAGSEAARTRSGAGLGLAIARAIVEGHGGRIWLADAARGTRVRISLPA